jgi:hypothetical protein
LFDIAIDYVELGSSSDEVVKAYIMQELQTRFAEE